jgi:HipA-like C-terminal domain
VPCCRASRPWHTHQLTETGVTQAHRKLTIHVRKSLRRGQHFSEPPTRQAPKEPRRKRRQYTTGRNQQINIKLKKETIERFRQYGAAPKEDMHSLWQRIVFNTLTSNTDDHLRNHGFLWAGPVGTRLRPQSYAHGYQAGLLTTAVDLEDGTASLEVTAYFELGSDEAHAIATQVAHAVAIWREKAAPLGLTAPEIDRMASALEHDDLNAVLTLAYTDQPNEDQRIPQWPLPYHGETFGAAEKCCTTQTRIRKDPPAINGRDNKEIHFKKGLQHLNGSWRRFLHSWILLTVTEHPHKTTRRQNSMIRPVDHSQLDHALSDWR